MTVKTCIYCRGSELRPAVDEVNLLVDGRAIAGTVSGEKCVTCSVGYYSAAALRTFELAVARGIAAESTIGYQGFRRMRAVVGVSRAELPARFGVAPEVLIGWLKGEGEIPDAAWSTMIALVAAENDD